MVNLARIADLQSGRSHNGKFRDECLNQNRFTDLTDARRNYS